MFSWNASIKLEEFNSFEGCVEFCQVALAIKKIQIKIMELQKDEITLKKDRTHSKLTVLSRLYAEIERMVDVFNQTNRESTNQHRKILILACDMRALISSYQHNYSAILNAFRDNSKRNATRAIRAGSYGSAFMAVTAASWSTLGTGSVMFFGGSWVNKKVKKMVGITSNDTETVELLKGLESELSSVISSMRILLGENDIDNTEVNHI
jgi:hypothetical protein